METTNMAESTSVSRRGFLAGAGALAAVAAAGLVGCSNPQKTPAPSDDATMASAKPALKDASSTRECDVLVVGLGASGLMAAHGAASKGASVIAIDTAPP